MAGTSTGKRSPTMSCTVDAKKIVVVDLMMSEMDHQVNFCRDRFNLGEDFDPELNLSFRKGRPQGGYGLDGVPAVWLPVGFWLGAVGTDQDILFEEYTPFAKHPKIGSYTGRWDGVLSVILCHELAHCLSSHEATKELVSKKVPKKYRDDQRSHGLFWQYVYSLTRPEVETRYGKQSQQ